MVSRSVCKKKTGGGFAVGLFEEDAKMARRMGAMNHLRARGNFYAQAF